MMIRVSTHFCSSVMPDFGEAHAPLALEVERLGDDADREDADFARGLGDHRRGAGAGAAAHAGGDEHHVRSGEVIADLVDRLHGGGAADIGLRSGAEALGRLHAHLDDALGLGGGQRLGIGVGDHEVDPLQPGGDHVVDRIAARAADAEHRDPRLQLPDVGDFQVDAHGCLIIERAPPAPPGSAGPPPAKRVDPNSVRSARFCCELIPADPTQALRADPSLSGAGPSGPIRRRTYSVRVIRSSP